MNTLKMGKGLHIYPRKKETGGFLGTLLASIGIPLSVEATKKLSGKGAPRTGLPKINNKPD